jgi:hypothetical protein
MESTPWYVDKKYKVVSVFNHEIEGVMQLFYKDGIYALTHFHRMLTCTMFIRDGVAYEDEELTKKYEDE